MRQATLVPKMNTPRTPLNMPIQTRRQRILRRRPQAASVDPLLAPLDRHPRWTYFLAELNEVIVKHAPSLRPPFLELLNRVDSV